MKKALYTALCLLCVLVFSACSTEEPVLTSTDPDYLAKIMQSPEGYPQFTKKEFLEITDVYLETGKWQLPAQKACFSTYGVNYSAYIVEGEYLFSLSVENAPDGSAEYVFYLRHYKDGVMKDQETDPQRFESFLD